nr:methylated-DNA--[protein]-cysteine S-methyltransferase [Mammaliicoccus sp. Marseille-Q6498]
MSLYQKSINTKAGNMIAIADETHLLLLHFINKSDIEKERSYLIRTTNQDILDESNNVLNQLEQELNLYFEGKLDKFTVPIKFNFGTPFQQKVWQALCDIPYGETISYKQLAENIGQPTAFRAVANANGKNHLTILVPCHRVIAADGGLGGYSSGIERKELILNIEKNI